MLVSKAILSQKYLFLYLTYSYILYISKLQYNTPSLLFLKQSSDPSGDQATTKLAISRF